jgi:hypothetical protein
LQADLIGVAAGQNREDAGPAFCRRDIDVCDPRMRMR